MDFESIAGRIFRRKTCDPFIIVQANTHDVIRTTVKKNKNFVQFEESRISPKINKNDTITISLWDDHGNEKNNVLLYSTSTNITNLLADSDKYDYPNFVVVKGFWKDEINYN